MLQALEILRTIGGVGGEGANVGVIYENYAMLYKAMGKHAKAESFFE